MEQLNTVLSDKRNRMLKEQRIEELKSLLSTVENICTEKDLRVGQLFEIIKHESDANLFYAENLQLQNLILKLLK